MSNELNFIEMEEAIEILLDELEELNVKCKKFSNLDTLVMHKTSHIDKYYIKHETGVIKIIPHYRIIKGVEEKYVDVCLCDYNLHYDLSQEISALLLPEDIRELGRFLKFILG